MSSKIKKLGGIGASLAIWGAASLFISNKWKEDSQREFESLGEDADRLGALMDSFEVSAPEIAAACREKAIKCTNESPLSSCDGHSFEGEEMDGKLEYRQIDSAPYDQFCTRELRKRLVGCLEDEVQCVADSLRKTASAEQ